jgi:hypothetical protein
MKIYFLKLRDRYLIRHEEKLLSYSLSWDSYPNLGGIYWTKAEARNVKTDLLARSKALAEVLVEPESLVGLRVVSWSGDRALKFVLRPLLTAQLILHPGMERVSGWKPGRYL